MYRILLSLALCGSHAMACVYFDNKFDRKLFAENEREALMFRDKEAVNLVLKTGFKGKLPPQLAWVFPLPSKPLSYEEADPEIFDELRKQFNSQKMVGGGAPRSVGGMAKVAHNIEIHKTVNVGSYEIIPIEILAETGAGEELNTWLRKQNFIELPARIQKPYLKKGAFFLAIRIKPTGTELSLKPLWIRYKASEMRFPLRFTHDDRTFNFTLYYVGSGDVTLGAAYADIRDSCVYLNRIKNTEMPGWMPKFRKLTQNAIEARLIRKIDVQGVNTHLKTAALSEDPGIDDNKKTKICQ